MISVLLTLAVFGFIVWLITLIPMEPTFRRVIIAVAIFALVIYMLQFLGIKTPFPKFW